MKPNPKSQQKLVDEWNSKHPIGTLVTRYALVNPLRGSDPNKTRTRSEAWLMGGHTAMVMIEGTAGGVMVESVVGSSAMSTDTTLPPETPAEATDSRLLKAGVPQSAIDRLAPELVGPVMWDADRFMFVRRESPNHPSP